MALSQFSLNEQNIIRAFLLQEGRLPTQSELNAAFTKTNAASGLEEAGLDIPASQEQSNTNFALAMYAAVGQDNPDSMGLQYWADAAQQNRAQALIDFQYATMTDIETTFATELAAIDATLVPSNDKFANPDEEPGGETPVDTVTTYVFNTTTANPYDDNQDGDTSVDPDSGVVDTGAPLTDAEKEAGASEKESYNHYIFNIGKDALDQGKSVATSSYTFELSNQAGSVKEYEGYFMSPLFFATGGTGDGSVATINIYDHFAVANDESETLTNSRTDVISFRLNGDKYAIVRNDAQAQDQSADTKTVVIEDLGTANTYAELVDAINDGIAALNAEDGVDIDVTAALGASTGTTDQRDASNQPTGASVVYRPIELTAAEGELTNPLASGTTPGNQTGNGYNAFYSLDVIGGTLGVISTNLELDNVGYLSQGGSINLAGQSQSDRGVEEFNVTTENGVWLTELRSNPLRADIDYLETINLTGTGYFKVGKQVDNGSFNVEDSATAGLVDVKTFNAAAFSGEIQLDADITADVIARDLNLRDDQDNAAGDNVTYSYNLGSGSDRLLLDIDGGLVEHEDAVVSVSLGAGNDFAHVTMDFVGNELVNQQDLDNITINAGSGNDTIWTEGSGEVTIAAGAGDDTVYTDNSGDNAIAGDSSAAAWVVNANNTDVDNLDGNPVGMAAAAFTVPNGNSIPAVFAGATLTVTYSAGVTGITAGDANDTGNAANENGFESTVSIPTADGVFGDQRHINQAIKEAINDDAVLNKLLVAEDGPDNTLIIRSLVDGSYAADDLEILVTAANVADVNVTAIEAAIQAAAADSAYDQDGAGPTVQDVLNASASTANLLPGVGADLAVQGTASSTTFVVDLATIDANGGGTLTLNVDGQTVTLTEGADFNQGGGNVTGAELAAVGTVTIGGVVYTITDTGGADEATLTATAGASPASLFVQGSVAGLVSGVAGSATSNLTGTVSTANNDGNVVDAGAGSDVVVLSTEANSNEIVTFNGNFGTVTIFNFDEGTNGAGQTAGQDVLDFSSYLTTMSSASGSTDSEVLEARTVVNGTGTAAAANSVTILDFAEVGGNDDTWEDVTAANLVAALNGDGVVAGNDLGSISNTLDAGNDNSGNALDDIVGNTLDHLVLVQNTANEGEYKVFKLTSTIEANAVDAGDFNTSATLVGTIDLGNSISNFDDTVTAGIFA